MEHTAAIISVVWIVCGCINVGGLLYLRSVLHNPKAKDYRYAREQYGYMVPFIEARFDRLLFILFIGGPVLMLVTYFSAKEETK